MGDLMQKLKIFWKPFTIIAIPLFFLPLPIFYNTKIVSCAYCVIVIGLYWISEVIPMAITSLLPVVLFPLFGIQDADKLTTEYLKDSTIIFIGGLILALGFEFSNLHTRIALRVMLFTGTSFKMLMLGMMVTTGFLSMWILNTAATSIMVPIITAVLDELEVSIRDAQMEEIANEELNTRNNSNEIETEIEIKSVVKRVSFSNQVIYSEEEKKAKRLSKKLGRIRTMFLLATCYSSNIGGTGMLSGSGTNLIAFEFLSNLSPEDHGEYANLTFANWFAFAIVPMAINIGIAWLYLQFVFLGGISSLKKFLKLSKSKSSNDEPIFNSKMEEKIKQMLKEKYGNLGKISFHEFSVGAIFLTGVISWILHDPKIFPGWCLLFTQSKVSIATAVMFFSFLCFIIPRNEDFYKKILKRDFEALDTRPLLEWKFVEKKLPWEVVILMGGGYALSNGVKSSGLSSCIGKFLTKFSYLPPSLMQLSCCFIIGFTTEIASNSAIASISIPILLEVSKELNLHPIYLSFPAAICCSYAFMLPVATPPNAIAYNASRGDMKVIDMIKTGFFMNCICIIVLFACINIYGDFIFHFSDYNYKGL